MKMNLSMDFLKPLVGTLKKYTALLPSVVITVIALLLYFPTSLVGNKVKDQMKKSARFASTVQSLSSNVPSKYEPQQLQIYMDTLEQDATKIRQLAIQSSQRNLVTYDHVIFPAPSDQSAQIFTIFGAKYRSDIESLIKKMNALDAPSDVEIRNAGGGGGTNPMTTRGTRTVNAQDPMVDAICTRRAKEISVYTNPSGFSWYGFWEKYTFSGKDQALQDCWDSQVALWVYEDIIDTIVKMNGSSGEVLSSPVKRLIGVSFAGPVVADRPNPAARYYGEMRGGMGMRDIPNYVTAMLPSNFMNDSPTARTCNEETDIIHFAVSVLVDRSSVLSFMKELCSEKPHSFYPSIFREPFIQQGDPVDSRHNQISILNTKLSVVDKTDPEHEFYRYGNGSVDRLDLICEYQFNRKGYDPIKPVPVKKRLGQEKTPENTVPGGSPDMGMDEM